MPSLQRSRDNSLIGAGNVGTGAGSSLAAKGTIVLRSESNTARAAEIAPPPSATPDQVRTSNRLADLPRRHLLLLALVLLLGLSLRLVRLGDQGLFVDEAYSWATTRLTYLEILQSPQQHHVPLYFWLLKANLAILPATEAGLRAPSLVLSILALLTLIAFLWSEWGPRAALMAGLLLAVSSFDVYYAQETRMYTLLSLLSLISYGTLVKALQGRPKWLAPWVLTSIALPWTHFFGFLALASQMIVVLIYLVRRQVFGVTEGLDRRWLVAAGVAIGVGVLPMALLLLNRTGTNSQGAAVPELFHLRDLFLLWTVGLAAVREHFLDSARLTWPLTADVPKIGWLVLGAALYGAPAVYGMAKAWATKGTQRIQVTLTLVSILLPVCVVFAYGSLTGQRLWIFRPFLGQGYLVYLWVGIGLASLRQPWLRWGLAAAAVVVAIVSLGPYFTIWQKSTTPMAMATAPRPDERNLLVVDAPFFGPQAAFYLEEGTPLMALYWDQTGAPLLARLLFSDPENLSHKIRGRPESVTCDDIATATDLWIYGNVRRIRNSVRGLPSCITAKRLWVFNDNAWVPLDLSG